MPNLQQTHINQITGLLIPLSQSEIERTALINAAFSFYAGTEVLEGRIDFSGSADVYVYRLIDTLLTFGEVKVENSVDSHSVQALWVLLEQIKERVGVEKQQQIDDLYNVVNFPIPVTYDPNPRNPYVGLSAFLPKDVDYFFGRDQMILEIEKNLELASPNEQFLAIVGSSGSGKSSLAMAGLIPRLAKNESRWVCLPRMRPSDNPYKGLAASLANETHADAVSIQKNIEDKTISVTQASDYLDTYLQQIAGTETKRTVLLLIDQFEELFTNTRSEDTRRRFIDLIITTLAQSSGSFAVVITLRADFYGEPMSYPKLGDLINKHSISMLDMGPDELRLVIEAPARKQNIWFESGLVGRILADMRGEAAALALLEYALTQLYNVCIANNKCERFTFKNYEQTGGIEGALVQKAEGVFTGLTQNEQVLARELFMRLVIPGGDEQDATRRRAYLSELHLNDPAQRSALDRVTKIFVAERLLFIDESTIEIAHETLIRVWGRLQKWINEKREDIAFHHSLDDDARDWLANPNNDALYRGTRLKYALDWGERNILNEREQKFLLESQDQEQKRNRAFRLLQIGLAAFTLLAVAVIVGVVLNRNYELTVSESTAVAAQITADFNAEQAQLAATNAGAAQMTSDANANVALTNEAAANNAQATSDANAAELAIAQETSVFNAEQAEIEAANAIEAQATSDANANIALTNEAAANNAQATSDANAAELAIAQETSVFNAEQAEIEAANAIEARATSDANANIALTNEADAIFAQATSDANAQSAIAEATNAAMQAAFALEAQATAERNEDEAQSIAWAVQAEQLYSDGFPLLAYPLILEANQMPSPPLYSQQTLIDLSLKPGPVRFLEGHQQKVSSVAFSPDGEFLVSGGLDGLFLWDMPSGDFIHDFNGQADSVNKIAFHPLDHDVIATGSGSGEITLWNLRTGASIGSLGENTGSTTTSLDFSPDGKYLLETKNLEYIINVWNLSENTSQSFNASAILDDDVPIRYAVVTHSMFSPFQNNIIWFSNSNGDLYFLDIDKIEAGPVVLDDRELGTITYFEVGRRGLLVGFGNGLISHWVSDGEGIESTTRVNVFDANTSAITDIKISPSGNRFITTNLFSGNIVIWNIQQTEPVQIFNTDGLDIEHIDLHPDGRFLVSGGIDGELLLWDLVDQTNVNLYNATNLGVFDVDLGASGQILVSGGIGQIGLWDTNTFANIYSFVDFDASLNGTSSVALSPDGTRALVTTLPLIDLENTPPTPGSGSTQLWQTFNPPKRVATIAERMGKNLAFTPDGLMAVAIIGREVKFWDADTGEPLAVGKDTIPSTGPLVFSPLGENILHVNENTLLYQNYTTGEVHGEYMGERVEKIESLAISPDQQFAVAGLDDGRVNVFDLPSLDLTNEYSFIEESVSSITVSPNNEQIIGGLRNGQIVVWSKESGVELDFYEGHRHEVTDVIIDPQTNRLISSSMDGTIKIWTYRTFDDAYAYMIRNRAIRDLSCAERQTYNVQPLCDGTP
ncbi:MAG: hypothetical protein AAFU54_30020 [Chloroflexota bacterium]